MEVFSGKPSKHFIIIGNVASDNFGHDAGKAVYLLKKRAAKAGADALINLKITKYDSYTSRIGASALMIRYNK